MVRFGGVQHGLLSAGRHLEHVGTHHTVRGGGVWVGGQSDRNVGNIAYIFTVFPACYFMDTKGNMLITGR